MMRSPAGLLAFRQLLRGVLLRRSKASVARQLALPPCAREDLRVKLSVAERCGGLGRLRRLEMGGRTLVSVAVVCCRCRTVLCALRTAFCALGTAHRKHTKHANTRQLRQTTHKHTTPQRQLRRAAAAVQPPVRDAQGADGEQRLGWDRMGGGGVEWE